MPADSLKSSKEARMSEADLANAAWWVWLWDEIEKYAFLGVVVALGIEFAALRFGAPYKASLTAHAKQELASTQLELARLKTPSTLEKEQRTALIEIMKEFAGLRIDIFAFTSGSTPDTYP